tara:strand:- start:395 stop:571 length:177 start_codon:yes stop_codon:yes gene_type:complete
MKKIAFLMIIFFTLISCKKNISQNMNPKLNIFESKLTYDEYKSLVVNYGKKSEFSNIK